MPYPVAAARGGKAPGRASTLGSGLVCYWPGNEASGDMLDLGPNAITLADSGAPGNAAGKVYPTARSFANASNQYFSVDSAIIKALNSFTFAAWVYPTVFTMTPGQYRFIGGDGGTTAVPGFFVFFNHEGQIVYDLSNGDGTSSAWHTPYFGTLDTWQHIIIWYDPDADLQCIVKDAGDVESTAWSTDIGAHELSFFVGRAPYGATLHYFDGRLGPLAIWNRVLTADERAELYNGGAGMTYPF